MSSTAAALQVLDFVRTLALAWKNVVSYPPGHPALTASLDAANRSLQALRGPAGEVTLGIAADALVYGDMKIDANAAQKFAQALFTRGVALIRFSVDTEERDLDTFLRVLARGARTGEKRSLADDLTAEGLVNINATAIHYGAVHVTDTLSGPVEEPERSVWEEILRALLENRNFAEGLREASPQLSTLDELSRLIAMYAEEVDEETTFDPKATFGIRLAAIDGSEHPLHRFLEQTVGERISKATGFKKQHALEQAVQLIKTLPDQLRRTILRAVASALAADETAGALLREFATELPGDEVLHALRYLSAMGPLSGHAMTLMQSLATIESDSRTEAPSESVVADLVRLFGDDDVNRFNPEDYRETLNTFALRIPEVPEEAMTSMEAVGLSAETVAQTTAHFTRVLFDMLHEGGKERPFEPVLRRIESVFCAHLVARHFRQAFDFVAELQDIANSAEGELRAAVEASIGRLAAGEAMVALIDGVHQAPADVAQHIQSLAQALGATAQQELLSALAGENNRSRRRRLFDFLVGLGPRIVPQVIPFLEDERWYVLRNMVALLRTVQDRTSLPSIRKLATHSDLRVRMEAIKSLFALDSNVPRSLLDDLLNDRDPKVAETAVTLVGNYAIKEGVDSLLNMIQGYDVFGTKRVLRMKAMSALGEIAEPRVLPHLERFLKPAIFPWPSRMERLAAWQSLQRYPPETRAAFVERGLRSQDPQVRAICAKLSRA